MILSYIVLFQALSHCKNHVWKNPYMTDINDLKNLKNLKWSGTELKGLIWCICEDASNNDIQILFQVIR